MDAAVLSRWIASRVGWSGSLASGRPGYLSRISPWRDCWRLDGRAL